MACLVVVACGGNDAPPPPSPSPGNPSPGDVQISAGDRVAWSQLATSAQELSGFQYAIYVDDSRSVLTGVSCGTTAGSVGFDCSAPVPTMSVGTHTIELTAFVVDGGVLESARSSPLRVTWRGLTISSGAPINPNLVTADHVRLNLQVVADTLALPIDLAFTPDGSMLVVERGGAVRVVRDGQLSPQPAIDVSRDLALPEGGLLAIAVDPKFPDNQFVYLLSATKGRDGSQVFTMARYRDVADRLGERAVLIDRIPASNGGASGALRFGPDAKLYLALDDADSANGRAAGSMSSFNGKVLRLNTDGTTPDDQAAFSPIYSLNHPLPRAFDWQSSSGEMWVVDGLEESRGRLTAVMVENARQKRGVWRAQYPLPPGTGPASATFYRGDLIPAFRDNLFIAAETGRYVLRLRFDPKSPERIVSAEPLLQDQIGPVRVVAVGPDQALYICNDTTLFRLAP